MIRVAVVLQLPESIPPCITISASHDKLKDKTKLLAYSGDPFLILALLLLDSSPLISFNPLTVFQSDVALLQHHSTNVLLPPFLSLVINVARCTATLNLGNKNKFKKKRENKRVVLQHSCSFATLITFWKGGVKKKTLRGSQPGEAAGIFTRTTFTACGGLWWWTEKLPVESPSCRERQMFVFTSPWPPRRCPQKSSKEKRKRTGTVAWLTSTCVSSQGLHSWSGSHSHLVGGKKKTCVSQIVLTAVNRLCSAKAACPSQSWFP